jgi:hypothetical protein
MGLNFIQLSHDTIAEHGNEASDFIAGREFLEHRSHAKWNNKEVYLCL